MPTSYMNSNLRNGLRGGRANWLFAILSAICLKERLGLDRSEALAHFNLDSREWRQALGWE
jgi:hypothetical protein